LRTLFPFTAFSLFADVEEVKRIEVKRRSDKFGREQTMIR